MPPQLLNVEVDLISVRKAIDEGKLAPRGAVPVAQNVPPADTIVKLIYI